MKSTANIKIWFVTQQIANRRPCMEPTDFDFEWMTVITETVQAVKLAWQSHLPLMRTLRRLLCTVVQFQRRFRNWYWHSLVPSDTPFVISLRRAGSFLHISASLPRNRRVFLQMSVGSITTWLPTALCNNQSINQSTFHLFLFVFKYSGGLHVEPYG